MINWNTDEQALKQYHPEEYKIWRVTQLINYGLEGEKLDKKFLIDNWEKIKTRIDMNKRKTLEWILWSIPYKSQLG